MITDKGRELASLLSPSIETTHEILVICSFICHARTVLRIATICNVGFDRAMRTMQTAVSELPFISTERIQVKYENADNTVGLVVSTERIQVKYENADNTVWLVVPDGRGEGWFGDSYINVP